MLIRSNGSIKYYHKERHMFESKVMNAFIASRSNFDMISDSLDKEAVSPYGLALFDAIKSYYTADPSAESVDVEVLKVALDRRFKDVPRNQERMHDKLTEVLSVDTSTVNVVREVLEQKRAMIGTHLADALLAQDMDRIEMYLQEYTDASDLSVLDVGEEEFQGLTLDALAAKIEDGGQWKLAPREIGSRIKGDLRGGHCVIVGARPERGKTLFGIQFAAGFLTHGAKVLYIGNEDPLPDLMLRMLSNLSGMSEPQMMADRSTAMERAVEVGYNNCVFAGLSPGSLYEVEALVRRHKPDIVLVDQMRNIRSKSENNTQRLEQVAMELRNIARRHACVMIALTQVGDSGRDKLTLNDGDIDGSNTGIPGACDVMILIGSNPDFEMRDLRTITLAKNKRGGDHSSFIVAVNRSLSRVSSYGT